MKKYWKLIVVTALVVLTLGTFYVNASLATMKYPEFVIKHKTGDENEIKNVSLSAGLQDGDNDVYAEITTEGTSYHLNYSYLDLIRGAKKTGTMERLQNEYRNFMRGKIDIETQYYEDENVLTYVDLKSDYGASGYGEWIYSFEIEVLDKATNKSSRFEVAVPESNKFNYVHIQQIQVMGGQIKVFAVNELPNMNELPNVFKNELHIYSVSLKNEELIRDDLLPSAGDVDSNYSVSTNILSSNDHIGPNKNVVYTIDVTEETLNDDGIEEFKIIDQQLMAYSLETDQQEEVILPDEYGDDVIPGFLSGTKIFFSRETDGQLEMIVYNIESKTIESTQTFDIPSSNSDTIFHYTFYEDKIYLMQRPNLDGADTTITIADLKTGDILYEGSVELVKGNPEKYDIEMNYIEVR